MKQLSVLSSFNLQQRRQRKQNVSQNETWHLKTAGLSRGEPEKSLEAM